MERCKKCIRDESMSIALGKKIRLVMVPPCGFNLQITIATIIWTHYKNQIGSTADRKASLLMPTGHSGDLFI